MNRVKTKQIILTMIDCAALLQCAGWADPVSDPTKSPPDSGPTQSPKVTQNDNLKTKSVFKANRPLPGNSNVNHNFAAASSGTIPPSALLPKFAHNANSLPATLGGSSATGKNAAMINGTTIKRAP
jgi:hypothetical protein